MRTSNRNLNFSKAIGVFAILGMSLGGTQSAFAAGYEKSIMWGGEAGGFAGIATPYTTGSEALYFNPAGLVGDKVGQDVSFNISPLWPKFSGPINNTNDEITSKSVITTPAALIYGNTLNDQFGFGVGFYVSGGTKATYETIDFPPFRGTPDVKSEMMIMEVAGGVGYKAMEDLKVGLAYRVVIASADFAFVQRLGPVTGLGQGLANIKLDGLKDTNYEGFKLGAQYKLAEKTLLGFTYRSEVNLQTEGTISGAVYGSNPSPAPASLALVNNSATVKTTFPMAATLGVQHDLDESIRLLAEYAWTQYSRVENIRLDGIIATAGGTLGSGATVQQRWFDQHNVRVAGEYRAFSWPIRAGYGWTNQVTNSDWARASFAAPAEAHTVTAGTGQTFKVMEMPVKFDGALEYTMAKGDGKSNTENVDIRPGSYSSNAFSVHLGASYFF